MEGEETGRAYEIKQFQKQELEKVFGASWAFDCPIYDHIESVQCELDNSELDKFIVSPLRMTCIECGFTVEKSHKYLSEVLFRDQILENDEQIFQECGITKK